MTAKDEEQQFRCLHWNGEVVRAQCPIMLNDGGRPCVWEDCWRKTATEDDIKVAKGITARENALQQQVRELEGRLKKYGQHAKGCDTGDPFYGLPCSCGLEAPLTSSPIAPREAQG